MDWGGGLGRILAGRKRRKLSDTRGMVRGGTSERISSGGREGKRCS